jgi:peptidoglycan hydrolase-like protein with peptidoglycan-binding domain
VATARALRSFQAQHGLLVTGRTNTPTWLALIVVVAKGATGDAVRAVQDQVNYRNLKGTGLLAVDGIFGAQTDAAVRGLQSSWGITSDGVVGAVTWRYLVSGYLSQ